MTVRPLKGIPAERVWGRSRLPSWASQGLPDGACIGELRYESAGGRPDELLVKYLFTSERLSIQVHPDDGFAQAQGQAGGKDEAWLVLDAEPGAQIGIGLTRQLSARELRQAALDGSIEQLLDLRPVEAGDIFYSPAGTIHALGAGLVLLEIQQNSDVTYRLYDYGRPRELHLDEAVAVASPRPFTTPLARRRMEEGRDVVAAGQAFTLERWTGPWEGRIDAISVPLTLIPLSGGICAGGASGRIGTVWSVDGPAQLRLEPGAELLVAYALPAPVAALRTALEPVKA